MNIKQNIVTSQNWTAGRQGHQVSGIVLHTMVGTTAGAQARFDDPSSGVSVHYGVSLDGSVTQWVRESDTAWQAGNWGVNLVTIGIEHEDGGNAQDAVRTPQLYQSSAQLVASICRWYNIPADAQHIFLHKNVIDTTQYPGGTSCPDGLDTNKIISMAQAILQGDNDVISNQADADLVFAATLHTINPAASKTIEGLEFDAALKNIQASAEWQAQDAALNTYLPQILGELGVTDPSKAVDAIKKLTAGAQPLAPGTYVVRG